MKRYLVFQGLRYDTNEGWNSFSDSFDDIEAAMAFLEDCDHDWYHVVDSTTGKKIKEQALCVFE